MVDPVPPTSGGALRSAGTAVLTGPSRLAAVARARHLLETSADRLDRLARLAADGGHAPIGIVSLLDEAHEHFVGTHGTRRTGAPVSHTLCQHVVGTDLPLVIDDLAGMDAGAARAAGVAAYAGFPVHLGGAAVGAVCVADGRPRRWTATELDAVSDAAGMVSAMLAEHDAAAHGSAAHGTAAAHGSAAHGTAAHDTAAHGTDGLAAVLRGFGAAGPTPALLDGLLTSLATTVVACDAQGRLVLADEGTAVLGGAPDHRQDAYHPDGRPMRANELPLMRALAGERLNSVPLLLRRPGTADRYYLCNGSQLVDDGDVLGAVVVVHEVTTMVRAGQFKDCEVAVSRVLESDPEFDHAIERVLDLVLHTLRWPHAELWRTSGAPADLRRCATASYTAPGRPGGAAGWPAGPGAANHAHVTGGIDGPPAPANELARRACERGRPVWTTDGPDGSVRPTLAVPIRCADRTLGVLTLFASTVDDPPELLEDLIGGVAAHVGMFIERTRVATLAQALASSKDEYIGLVGHEMRTPLTSISAYTDLVIEDPGLSDDVRSMLEVVQRNAAALRAIIANLLDLAAFDSGHARVQLNPTDVSDLVRAAVNEAVAAPGGPELTADIQPGLLVAADVPRLRQAVDNLLSNALRYTPAGTVVVKLAAHGETGVLEVADTGIGIPRNERPKLFGRFFRGRNAKGMGIPGSGLGLAIARAIVEAHHGTLEFVERPGPGSTFRLRIPLTN